MTTFRTIGRAAPVAARTQPVPVRFVHRGNPIPPSVRHGIRWRALPVEGSRAWLNSRKRSGALLGHLKGIFA